MITTQCIHLYKPGLSERYQGGLHAGYECKHVVGASLVFLALLFFVHVVYPVHCHVPRCSYAKKFTSVSWVKIWSDIKLNDADIDYGFSNR